MCGTKVVEDAECDVVGASVGESVEETGVVGAEAADGDVRDDAIWSVSGSMPLHLRVRGLSRSVVLSAAKKVLNALAYFSSPFVPCDAAVRWGRSHFGEAQRLA
jgi:hypothetical protein